MMTTEIKHKTNIIKTKTWKNSQTNINTYDVQGGMTAYGFKGDVSNYNFVTSVLLFQVYGCESKKFFNTGNLT